MKGLTVEPARSLRARRRGPAVEGGGNRGPTASFGGWLAVLRPHPYTHRMHRVTQEHGVTIIELGPSYAALEYDALQECGEILLAQAADVQPARLILDMSQTTFVGSSFIELLVRAWKRIKRRDGSMALCGLQPFCLEVIKVSRLDTIWPIYADRAEAMREMSVA
jgi:anti-sigma B factor antagonist